jgi:predicted peptidase
MSLTSSALAQEQKAGTFEAEIKITMKLKYLLFTPKAKEGTKLPMIVFLHGAGERGDKIERVASHGPPKIVKKKKDFPFIVLSPQCAKGKWWKAEILVKLIDEIIAKHPVDPDRVYLTGLSMGGYGSWELSTKYPDRFAAVAPICGGGKPETVASIKHLPIWVFHGAKDNVVPLKRSQEMVDALKRIGGNVRFTIYPDANHNSWTKSYDNPELYEWFLEHRRKPQKKSRKKA